MFRSMIVAGAAVVSFAAPAFVPAASADEVNSPPLRGHITVDVVTVNGSGCPAGTAKVWVSPDNTTFTVTYTDYYAWVGPDAPATDWRKNCQLNLRVQIPQGFTYAIARADYQGYAHLDHGVRGLQRANYYFQGTAPTAHVNHYFNGPFDDDWRVTDITDVAALVFAPCGRSLNLNVNTELRVKANIPNPNNVSFMTMDKTRGSVNTVYHFAWERC